jgi:HEAT repeat protein
MNTTAGKNGNLEIKKYITNLANKNQAISQEARNFLLNAGESAVENLIESLASPNSKIRWEAGKILENSEFDWSKHDSKETLSFLVDLLTSNDGFVRTCSRNSLIKIGSEAVPMLVEALASKENLKRWESIKALSQIGDSAALNSLVSAMDDKVFDVRWVAAEGLIAIGNQSIEPLLDLILNHPDSVRLREGVHHVLYALNKEQPNEILKPVIDALEATEASLQVPWVAEKALKSLRNISEGFMFVK